MNNSSKYFFANDTTNVNKDPIKTVQPGLIQNFFGGAKKVLSFFSKPELENPIINHTHDPASKNSRVTGTDNENFERPGGPEGNDSGE